VENIADRASAFGMPGVVVDGNDVVAVYEVAGEAIDRARSGKGPSLIEAKTYRMRGHYEGDLQGYRDQEDVEKWRDLDPLANYRKRCLELGIIKEGLLSKLREEYKREVDEAVEFAKMAPYPEPEELLSDVFEDSSII
jgi:pyruvate dehydrogenase E1 component alpha subunit